MQNLAICRGCRHAFLAQRVANASVVARCPMCGSLADTSDGSAPSLIALFNAAYPGATPRSTKREVWKLAAKVAAGEMTTGEAIARLQPHDDGSFKENATFYMNVIMMFLAIVTFYQSQSDRRSANDTCIAMLSTLGQMQATLEQMQRDDEDPQ